MKMFMGLVKPQMKIQFIFSITLVASFYKILIFKKMHKGYIKKKLKKSPYILIHVIGLPTDSQKSWNHMYYLPLNLEMVQKAFGVGLIFLFSETPALVPGWPPYGHLVVPDS